MKNLKYIFIFVIGGFLSIVLSGCEKKEDPTPTPAKWPEKISVEGVGTFILVETDTINGFTMGVNDGSNSAPAHKVIISNPYYMAEYEVSQKVWKDVTGANPSDAAQIGDDFPVNKVTNSTITEFVKQLNEKTGRVFAIPTEAQWEFAAMGGLKSKGYLYSGDDDIDLVAWYTGNSDDLMSKVGQKQPNELGLYDMSGNVGEFVADKMSLYSDKEQKDPVSTKGTGYVVRGGFFDQSADQATVKSRSAANGAFYNIGVRLVLTAPNDNELIK